MNTHEIATQIYQEFCETLKTDPDRAKVVLISKIQIALREANAAQGGE